MNRLMVIKRDGFSLIEVLIGLIFLAIGLLAIASLQITSVRGNFFSGSLMQATYMAQDRLEYLKNLPLNDPFLDTGPHDDGTTKVSQISQMAFHRAYAIESVYHPNGNYLKIDYSVSWNDGIDHRISFSTFRAQ